MEHSLTFCFLLLPFPSTSGTLHKLLITQKKSRTLCSRANIKQRKILQLLPGLNLIRHGVQPQWYFTLQWALLLHGFGYTQGSANCYLCWYWALWHICLVNFGGGFFAVWKRTAFIFSDPMCRKDSRIMEFAEEASPLGTPVVPCLQGYFFCLFPTSYRW